MTKFVHINRNNIFFGTLFFAIGVLTSTLLIRLVRLPDSQKSLPVEKGVSQNTLISFGKNQVAVNRDSVAINVWFEGKNPLAIILDKSNYPELFSSDEFARIHAEEKVEGDNGQIKLIRIAKQIPDHGSWADSYYVIVDPEIGKVVATGYDSFFGSVRINNSCMNCYLPMMEFKEYSRKDGKYLLTNYKHKQEFKDLLKRHQELAEKEDCRINGKDMTIKVALETAKGDDKCADLLSSGTNNEPAESFITIGQYRMILNNIKRVINSENIPIFDKL